METGSIAISAEVDADTAKIIENGLNRFNEEHNGPDPTKPVWAIYRDGEGTIAGGLLGHTIWDWFAIAMLWVAADHRGRGIGSRLLREAEQTARMRGCRRSLLATMTFQAPGFYAKHGYAEIGRIVDYPPGHAYISMVKDLTK